MDSFPGTPVSPRVSADFPAVRVGSEIPISEFKTPRSRVERGFREVTTMRAWQKTWQKRRQKSAKACTRSQVAKTRKPREMPQKTAFWRTENPSQLSYGDLIATAFVVAC